MHNCEIWVGNDTTGFATSLTMCATDIFDTGIVELSSACRTTVQGFVVTIRRKAKEIVPNNLRRMNLY